MQIENQAAIVTRGVSGLGLATGEMVAAAGAKVALLDLDADRVTEAAKRIGGIGLQCDVAARAPPSMRRRGASGPRTRGDLVNCAGTVAAKRIVGRDGPMQLRVRAGDQG